MKNYDSKHIKNIAITGHSGSGKTALCEALLYKAGATDRLGKTADGNTVSDYTPIEIAKKCSIYTSLSYYEKDGIKVNILDTPGLFDYAGGLIEGVYAADCVMITVSAKSGIHVGTKKAYECAVEHKTPHMFVVTKIDDDNANYSNVITKLKTEFGSSVCPLVVPLIKDNKIVSYYDLLAMKNYKYGPKGERIEIDLNNIMYDYADNFVEENRGIEFEDFRMELIREVAVEPQIDEATYKDAKPGELVEAIVKALKEAYARRAKAVADTVRPVMERIYEDRKDQLDSNIYFPLTDGHLGYNIPVNLQKCKDTDGAEIYKVFSKVVMFTTIDDAWREHLREMDDLRQSVQNATYEQKDPLLIYKFESFGLFSKMIVKVNRDVLAILNKAYIPVRDQNAEAVQRERQERAKVDVNKLQASRMQAAAQAGQQDKQKPMPLHVEKKVGRNDPCPCGSGKKYKQCHGKGI